MVDDRIATLSLDISISFTDFDLRVKHDLALDGVTGLFGPSGSGKSTLLRLIAGLERNGAGRLLFDGEAWQDSDKRSFVPPYRRPVGYVFQDARLFEHLTVYRNLRYAEARCARRKDSPGFDDIVAAFDLGQLLQRQVPALSGGEKQRVAIARTLLVRPRLLLLDEPLASIDTARRMGILPYLETVSRRFQVPTIYVSHAVDEIARLADRVVVMDNGRIKASGSVVDTLNELEPLSTSTQFELASILETRVVRQRPDYRLTELDHHGQRITVPMLEGAKVDDSIRLHIRAGDVALATAQPDGLSFRNVLRGEISEIASKDDSAFAIVSIRINGGSLRSHITRHAVAELGLQPGTRVYALLKTASFDLRP